MQPAQRGKQPSLHRLGGGDVHHGREIVVRGLAAVDVVVRMHRLPACRAAGRGSRWRGSRSPRWRSCWSACPMPVCQTGSGNSASRAPSAISSRRLLDRLDQLGRQLAEPAIGLGAGPFVQADGADQPGREALRADAEQLPGALGLRPPVAVGRDVDGAEAVGLGAASASGTLRDLRAGSASGTLAVSVRISLAMAGSCRVVVCGRTPMGREDARPVKRRPRRNHQGE